MTHRKLSSWTTTDSWLTLSVVVHEDVLDAMQARLDAAPEKMRERRQTVAHPFGTLKAWMGATHFLTQTLPRVSTEMSLHVLAYHMTRVMNLLGVGALLEAMRV